MSTTGMWDHGSDVVTYHVALIIITHGGVQPWTLAVQFHLRDAASIRSATLGLPRPMNLACGLPVRTSDYCNRLWKLVT